MGFKTPDMPPVKPEEFEYTPVMERIRTLATHWAEYGFGGPKQMHLLYLVKTVLFVVGGWLVVGSTTPGISLFDLGGWWGELIVYQKLMVWTVLWEITGHAASWGPLAFKFGPMLGGWRYWARVGTLRLPPYPDKVPGTLGDHRTVFDVGLYLLILATLLFLLLTPGSHGGAAYSEAGLLPGWALLTYVALILIMGFRDRVVFLASRPEQYAVCLLAFGVLTDHVDMVLVAKIAMVTIWLGAGVSKFGRHFSLVVQAMLSNTPWLTSRRFKRSLYRNAPNDLRPSKMAFAWAHLGGTVVELVLPLVLLFSVNETLTWLAIAGMMLFHLFIYSTYPLAVPSSGTSSSYSSRRFCSVVSSRTTGTACPTSAVPGFRRRAGALPDGSDSGEPEARVGVFSGLPAAVFRKLGIRDDGVPDERRGGQAR